MFVPPPLVEFTSVESEVKKRRARTGDVLPDGILEFRFIDEGRNGTNGLRRVARGRAEKGWADRVCSGVVIGNYSGPNGERGENETPSSENDARAGDEFKTRTGTRHTTTTVPTENLVGMGTVELCRSRLSAFCGYAQRYICDGQ